MTYNLFWTCQHLRSISITETSTLLRTDPPLCAALVLKALQGFCLARSLSINTTGSQVPYKSLYLIHATSMPVAVWTVKRFPPNLSQKHPSPLVLTTQVLLSTPHQWFTCVRLSNTHLTKSLFCLFPQRLQPWLFTTAAWGGLEPTPLHRFRETLLSSFI